MSSETSNDPSQIMYLEIDDTTQFATIYLNRLDKRNALNWAMFTRLDELLDEVSQNPKLRGLILRSTGEHFSAGIDISLLSGQDPSAPQLNLKGATFRFNVKQKMQPFFTKLEVLEIPTIAVLDGMVLGSGFELVLACDFRIATTRAVFQMKESHLGIIPDLGGTTRLARLINPSFTKEICLIGRKVTAEDGYRMGFLNHIAPTPEELEKILNTMVEEILIAAPLAMGLGKKLVDQMYAPIVQEGLDREAFINSLLFETKDFRNAVMAWFAKEKIVWKRK